MKPLFLYHHQEATSSASEKVEPGDVIQQPLPVTVERETQQALPSSRERWLLVIGLFKFAKGVFFILIGVGVLKLVHRDLGDILFRLALQLRLDPESHLVNLLLDKVQGLTPHRLRWIGTAVFLDAGLDFIEGTGLILHKAWAEYFTLILTASFLPYELFEIIRHVTLVKIGLTILNLLVVIYLAYILKQRETVKNLQDQ